MFSDIYAKSENENNVSWQEIYKVHMLFSQIRNDILLDLSDTHILTFICTRKFYTTHVFSFGKHVKM